MSREEAIKEIERFIIFCDADTKCPSGKTCSECAAEKIYDAGYRKQSEVHPMPCKIGDKIYEVTGEPGERIDIDEYTVSEVGVNGVFTHGGILGLRHKHYFTYVDEGVWWFFKREDAEAEKKRRDDP